MEGKTTVFIMISIQIIFATYFFIAEEMDVIRFLIILITPMLLSAALLLFTKPMKTSIYLKILVYSIPNLIFNIVIAIIVNDRVDEILNASLKYESVNLEISKSNSPLFSLVLILAVSVGLHYLAGQIKLSMTKNSI